MESIHPTTAFPIPVPMIQFANATHSPTIAVMVGMDQRPFSHALFSLSFFHSLIFSLLSYALFYSLSLLDIHLEKK